MTTLVNAPLSLAEAKALVVSMPGPESCRLTTRGRRRCYTTPAGFLPSVTTILKVLGLGTEGLIAWSGRVEREACLAACGEQFAEMDWSKETGPAEFVALVESRLGASRQHQKEIALAQDIGTSIHQAVQRRLQLELGLEVGPEPALSDPAQWAYMAWEDWWERSGYQALATEQPIYHEKHRYAGTIDALVLTPEGRVGLIDLKSSKAVYDSHHLQVAAYLEAASHWVPIDFAEIVRLPKNLDDPKFEVVPLGKLYDRELSLGDLVDAFTAAVMAYQILLAKDGI